MVHQAHWERLALLDPDDVCRRSGARYDPAGPRYILPLLNSSVVVRLGERRVAWCDRDGKEGQAVGLHVALVAVVYLIEANDMHPAVQWVPAEALPSGAFFFRGPHFIPTAEIASTLGQDRERFLEAGRRLDGVVVEWGDACVQLQVLPRVAVRLVLWLGDDEFPARVAMLVDRLADQQLPLDALLSMAQYVGKALLQSAGKAA